MLEEVVGALVREKRLDVAFEVIVAGAGPLQVRHPRGCLAREAFFEDLLDALPALGRHGGDDRHKVT